MSIAAKPARSRSTESVDNYLKAILALTTGDTQRVNIKSLAERLSVAPASVTNMLQKLAATAAPLVEYERHRGVRLSPRGRLRALEIVRHHRLIETFLYEILDYPIDEVHDEAERLEHFISERFEERIAAKLGHPRTDPHGHAIPTMQGEIDVQPSIPLAEVTSTGHFVIESISDRHPTHLQLIESCGIVPGAHLRVRHIAAKEGFSVSLGRSTKTFTLAPPIAADLRIVPR